MIHIKRMDCVWSTWSRSGCFYASLAVPKHPSSFKLDEAVPKLKKLFGLQYFKSEADEFISYAAMINKHCESFQPLKLSSDQFKAL